MCAMQNQLLQLATQLLDESQKRLPALLEALPSADEFERLTMNASGITAELTVNVDERILNMVETEVEFMHNGARYSARLAVQKED